MKTTRLLRRVCNCVIVSSNGVLSFGVYFRHSFLKVFCRERSIAIWAYWNGQNFRSVSGPLGRIGCAHALTIGTHIAHETNSKTIEISGVFRRQIDEITRPVHQAPTNIMAIRRAITSEIAKIVRALKWKSPNGNDPRGAVRRFQMEIDAARTFGHGDIPSSVAQDAYGLF